MRNGADGVAQQQTRGRVTDERVHEPIVAALDPEELRLRRRPAFGHLFDDGQHRDFIGIGEEEAAQRRRHRVYLLRRVRLAEVVAQGQRRHVANGVGGVVATGTLVAANER